MCLGFTFNFLSINKGLKITLDFLEVFGMSKILFKSFLKGGCLSTSS